MNLSEFLSYKDKGHTHIPVYEEFVADLIVHYMYFQISIIKKILFF